ncbi:glycosyltransferase family 2 protein [Demequina sp. NBRC 110051]|uniref:glycosyltransferase family 2 protein n=1 Tax=Demequina sp. NBRC 110051 TaxID=1570340 RepID=UPI0009FEEB29|nr:glycosyltransferase [Demequina sp. NBRC 110051]
MTRPGATQPGATQPLGSAVILASAGRPALLAQAMAHVESQSVAPCERILSVPDASSLPANTAGWTVVTGTKGLAAQRNAGLDALSGAADVVVFFDDDAVPRSDYLAQTLIAFTRWPDLAGLTGKVLLDGAAHSSGEVSVATADAALAQSWEATPSGVRHPRRTLYGCNFAYRLAAAPTLRFDARLPLYSWLEDHDFARRLMRHGALAAVDDCVVVHRGADSGGRTNHVRLGYSQLMNPVHLARSGSFPAWLAGWEIARPTAKNLAYAVAGAQSPWRRERLRGNLMGLGDALRGRDTPERIVEL